jgi:hypothetical protein
MGKVENRIIFQAGFKTTKTVGKFYGQANIHITSPGRPGVATRREKSVRVGTWHNSNYYYIPYIRLPERGNHWQQ